MHRLISTFFPDITFHAYFCAKTVLFILMERTKNTLSYYLITVHVFLPILDSVWKVKRSHFIQILSIQIDIVSLNW